MVCMILTMPLCRAATGFCNTTGGPKIFNVDASTTVANPDDNQSGKSFSERFGSSENYTAHCDCDDSDLSKDPHPGAYYKSEYLAPMTQYGDAAFIHVNDDIDLSAAINIANVGDVNVPFTDIWNKKNNGCSLNSFTTGQSGSLTFRINKPFLGQSVIPQMAVAAIYGTVRPGQYATEPMAKVFVQGTVTVPQSCEINAGEVISVDFGTIFASNFTTRGHKPDQFIDKKTVIAYVCKNISDGVTLTMTFSGAAADGMPEALATTNPDIGVLMKNSSEQVLPINTSELPMPLNPSTDISRRTGSVNLFTAPVNLSGKTPQNGAFSGSAAITVNIR
ncbi:fimbrial protein [Cronobacter condimenti 1330]|uniref:Fimbrial protein n=1 Tax=Cronobacter condimenti 1330 TaxID=1073999 RepID=A0ABM5VJE7_9ENTR|nr:fimbrial protein [Cronobacter condimenti 1330]